MPAFIHFVNEYGKKLVKKTNKIPCLVIFNLIRVRCGAILSVLIAHRQH